MKSALYWLIAIVITVCSVIYQRATGPTYPVKGKILIDNEWISYKLIRTDETLGDGPTEVKIKVDNPAVTGSYTFKRYKSYDEWTTRAMKRQGDYLVMEFPRQPMAGKIQYRPSLYKDGKEYPLVKEDVVMRYKGHVPDFILWPHIFFMFFAMLWSMRAGISAIVREKTMAKHAMMTWILLIPGGLILGPIVQKYAFDAFWTGWPFGHDLTDNKTIVAFIFWLIAWYQMKRDRKKYYWGIIAAVVMMAVYLIPHSALGSEIDHTKNQVEVVD